MISVYGVIERDKWIIAIQYAQVFWSENGAVGVFETTASLTPVGLV